MSGNRLHLLTALLLAAAPLANADGFESGDFSSLPWTTSGDASWFVTSNEANTGTYSAQAGDIGDDQSSTLEVAVYCTAGDASFYRMVSSESSYDYLYFYIDGVEKGAWSGSVNWGQVSYAVSEGFRTFKWVYSKDGSDSSGSDTAWIDDFIYPFTAVLNGPGFRR